MRMLTVEGSKFFDKGSHRHVYIDCRDETMVLKHAPNEAAAKGSIAESRIWDAVKDIPELRRWFNPVISMNQDGSVLKMPLIERVDYREKHTLPVQEWMTDAGWKNWGRTADGDLVLLDYGSAELRHRIFKLVSKERK